MESHRSEEPLVLRFRSTPVQPPARWFNRTPWRLWMLVAALGLVLALMNQIRQPNTTRQLNHLFSGQQQSAPSSASADPSVLSPSPKSLATEVNGDLSLVKDNTYFRPQEHAPWFDLFAQLKAMNAQQLKNESPPEMTYAQLLKQPALYRGRIVTVRGTALREEVVRPPENALGIQSYHRLWLQPAGGGQWPFVVYCLELPERFPRGKDIGASVSVTGFFFKNWSYAWKDGLGLAPVVLARGPDWSEAAVRPASEPIAWQSVVVGVVGASMFAVVAVWFAFQHTKRRPPISELRQGSRVVFDTSADQEVKQQLQRLADEGREV